MSLRKSQFKAINEMPLYFQYISQEDNRMVWSLLEDLQTQIMHIISLKDLHYLKRTKNPLNSLGNSNNPQFQIEEIESLLKDYSKSELKFSQLFHEIVKDAQNKYSKSSNRFSQNKEKNFKDTMSSGQKAIFQFSQILPLENFWLIASSGNKYRNPCGCKWSIIKPDAFEFQKKGYGKIVEEIVYSKK